MALLKQDDGEEKIIKPDATTPAIDTSGWPLLLRNWDQCKFRTLFLKSVCDTHLHDSTRANRALHPNP